MPLLHNGSRFPFLSFPKLGGGELRLPNDLLGSYGVVLFYRGAWCPYCNAQLSLFARAEARLSEAGIKVAAISVDDEAAGRGIAEKHRLNFPIGYGANADQVAAAIGAFTNPEPRYLQSTGFVLDPEGRVVNAVYSSGPIGRLLPDDVAGLVTYLKSHA